MIMVDKNDVSTPALLHVVFRIIHNTFQIIIVFIVWSSPFETISCSVRASLPGVKTIRAWQVLGRNTDLCDEAKEDCNDLKQSKLLLEHPQSPFNTLMKIYDWWWAGTIYRRPDFQLQ
jgi:hypothetical protein